MCVVHACAHAHTLTHTHTHTHTLTHTHTHARTCTHTRALKTCTPCTCLRTQGTRAPGPAADARPRWRHLGRQPHLQARPLTYARASRLFPEARPRGGAVRPCSAGSSAWPTAAAAAARALPAPAVVARLCGHVWRCKGPSGRGRRQHVPTAAV